MTQFNAGIKGIHIHLLDSLYNLITAIIYACSGLYLLFLVFL